MDKKVILISIDGMRPDGLEQCGSPAVAELKSRCSYTMTGCTVMPSVTFPCHFSMTHSVAPSRHGILSNTYIPQVRPVKGIFERVRESGGVSAFFYGWEPLRDIALPGTLRFATYIQAYMEESSDTVLTEKAIETIDRHHPDFVMLYMVETDEKGGHDSGWMTETYLRHVRIAFENAKRIIDRYGDEYSVIITADHGGHDRSHGTDKPEDTTIPLFFYGPAFEAGRELSDVSILDVAPTIAKLMNIEPEPEWEGKALCE